MARQSEHKEVGRSPVRADADDATLGAPPGDDPVTGPDDNDDDHDSANPDGDGFDSFLQRVARAPEVELLPVAMSEAPLPGIGRTGSFGDNQHAGPASSPDSLRMPPAMLLADLPMVAPELYDQRQEHARGGMGRIVRCRDRRLLRTVAVKELLSDSPAAAARFVREALVTARLQHPAIVPVHEAGRWPSGKPFYSMKLISGRPLSALIRERKGLSERLALLPVVLTVAEAVAYAHSRKIIHRDLKPANVVVGEFGETMLIDWGLAKVLGVDSDAGPGVGPGAAETTPGLVIGTPGFMPPEQAEGRPVDERADVYALGALLYNTLAGAPPYPGRSPGELLAQVIEGPPVPLLQRQPGVPPDLLSIVDKAMARAVAARYPTARELAADLSRFNTGQLVAAHRYSTLTLLLRAVRRHRAAVGMAAVVLVVLTGSAYRVLREWQRSEAERRVALSQQAAAESARTAAVALNEQLLLAQARNRAEHDPTAALAWLKRLRPESQTAAVAREIANLAASRGVAARLLAGLSGPVRALAFDGPGRRLAAADEAQVLLWDLGGGTPRKLAAPMVSSLHFAAGGSVLLAGGQWGVRVFDLTAGLPAGPVRALSQNGAALAVAPGADLAAVGDEDGGVALFALPGGVAGPVLHGVGAGPMQQLVFSGDGTVLAARDGQGIQLWQLRGAGSAGKAGMAGKALGPRLVSPGAGNLALSQDGRILAAAAPGGALLWELPSLRQRRLAEDGTVMLVALSPDGSRLGTANGDGTVRLWDLDNSPKVPNIVLSHHGAVALDLLFSADGRRLMATRGSMVRAWTLPADEPKKLRGAEQDVERLALSPDGSLLAAGSHDGALRLWVMDGGPAAAALGFGHPGPVPTDGAALPAWMQLATSAVLDDQYRLVDGFGK